MERKRRRSLGELAPKNVVLQMTYFLNDPCILMEENSEKFKGTLKILNNKSTTQSSILKSAVGQGTTLSTKTFKNQLVQIQAIR